MADFGVLKRQHLEILAAGDRLLGLVRDEAPERLDAIAKCRMEPSRLVHENLRMEEVVMNEPLRRERLTGRIPNYGAIMAGETRLRVAYSAHVHQWTIRTIGADWAGYAGSVRTLVAALRQVIRQREGELFPVAERLLSDRGAIRTAVLI